jgi:hypothetical protein
VRSVGPPGMKRSGEGMPRRRRMSLSTDSSALSRNSSISTATGTGRRASRGGCPWLGITRSVIELRDALDRDDQRGEKLSSLAAALE